MSRIPTPESIDAAPIASRPLLEGVKKQLGVVPNMFRLISNSPAALEGYLDLSAALSKGGLPASTRERIALAVAEEMTRIVNLPAGERPFRSVIDFIDDGAAAVTAVAERVREEFAQRIGIADLLRPSIPA